MLKDLKNLALKMKKTNNKDYCVIRCKSGNLDIMEFSKFISNKDIYDRVWCTNGK